MQELPIMTQTRNTRQRLLVLDAVQARHDHPTADDIYLDVRARDGRISRGTVYRNLGLLARTGEILQVKVPAADRFDSRLDLHYHLLCTRCGSLADVSLPYQEELDQRLSEASGYQITRHRTVFEGVCPACQAAQETAQKTH